MLFAWLLVHLTHKTLQCKYLTPVIYHTKHYNVSLHDTQHTLRGMIINGLLSTDPCFTSDLRKMNLLEKTDALLTLIFMYFFQKKNI